MMTYKKYKKDYRRYGLISLKLLPLLIILIFVLYNAFGLSLTSVVLNATSSDNLTTDNLTAYPIGALDYITLSSCIEYAV
jgi:hypothetical protein